MRFDTKIEFLQEANESSYDPDSGTYQPLTYNKLIKYCFVEDLSSEYKLQVYGKTNVQAYRLCHLGKKVQEYGHIMYNNQRYKITDSRQLKNRATYLIVEVNK